MKVRRLARQILLSRGLQPARSPMREGRRCKKAGINSSPAFTLVELVVVVGVILIILGLVVPAASALWNERKNAEAVNTIQGLFITARARALESDGVETGFFAYVDDQGVQRLAPIRQWLPSDQIETASGPPDPVAWQHVFVLIEEREQTMPAPMRVVPRYAVQRPKTGSTEDSYNLFDEDELANNDFGNPIGDQAQRHRNFFSMIFSTDGALLVNRQVLIQDTDEDKNGRGDRTNLSISTEAEPTATEYYARNNRTPNPKIDDARRAPPFPRVIVDPDDDKVALNFASVDGLLVYDDSLLAGIPVTEQRRILLRTAQPLYLSRWTGVVIRGPVGEDLAR